MLRPYREILSIPGARAFAAAGLVGRMPISMIGIGVILLVVATTGSYGIAGIVAATLTLAYAVIAPQVARLVDHFGQAQVLVPALAVHVLALIALMVAAVGEAPYWALYGLAGLAGGAGLSIGSLVRARWAHLLAGSPRLNTAYSLESIIDEVIFVLGPVMVTVLATQVHRLAGLTAVIIFAVGGGLALAAQRGTQPPVTSHPVDGQKRVSALRSKSLPLILPAMVGTGGVFGSVEVTVVGFADAAGAKVLSGPVLAAYAMGSLISGLLYGTRHWTARLDTRFVVGSCLMAVSVLAMPWAPNLWALAVIVFIAGFAISPTLIAGFGLVEERVPASSLTEGLTWVTTGIGFGVTAGAAVAGQVIDVFGASRAFWVSVGSGLLAALVALAVAPALRRFRGPGGGEPPAALPVSPEPWA